MIGDDSILAFVLFGFILAIFLFVGCCVGKRSIRTEAVTMGYAEYVVDKEGVVTWRWK